MVQQRLTVSTVCGEIYQEMRVSPKIQKVESSKKKKKKGKKKIMWFVVYGAKDLSKYWTELTLKKENLPCRIHS